MSTTKKKDELEQQQTQTMQQTTPTQSNTVQQAQNTLMQLSGRNYQSQWQPQIDTMMDQYLNRDKFSYDVNEDALYQQLRDQYRLMGQTAMMDTMGQAQAMTGGYGNSYAQGVGQQAYQGYMQQLNDQIPDLYQLALNQYMNEGDKMLNDMSLLMQQDSIDYDRYRDQMADQDDAYNKLIALMTQYHYEPTQEEMDAAGMTKAQKNAIMQPYYDYLAALAAAAEEENSGGGGGAYIDPNAQPKDGGGVEDWITYADVQAEVNQLKQVGASRQDINTHIENMVNSSNYKPDVSVEQDTKELKTVKRK